MVLHSSCTNISSVNHLTVTVDVTFTIISVEVNKLDVIGICDYIIKSFYYVIVHENYILMSIKTVF